MQADIKNKLVDIGRRIRAARTIAGLTQTDLANKVGVHMQTVSKWERGVQIIEAYHFADLCIALDCSADFLLGFTDTIRRQQ